jgi:hypothetical protein
MFDKKHPYIWSDDDNGARHQYRNFRYAFELDGKVQRAELNLFADTRYRLYVNGTIVGHGPGRFKVGFPEYDTHDIAGLLVPGKNVIAVTVCSYGWGTFLTDESRGGLVAWGDVITSAGCISLSTSKGWKVSSDTGYNPDTPIMSFALGMMEDQDTRLESARWTEVDFDDSGWKPAVPVAGQDHWGTLHPRSIPLCKEIADRVPHGITRFDSAPLRESCFSATFVLPQHETKKSAMALNLKVPEKTSLRFATVIADHWLNSEKLVPERSDENANRNEYAVILRPGDNMLVVELPVWRGFFPWSIGWDSRQDLEFSALPGTTHQAMRLPFADYMPNEAGDACHKALRSNIQGLEPVELSPGLALVCVQRGWRQIDRKGPEAGFPLSSGALSSSGGCVWVMDFCREVLGRVRLDFDAPAGTVLHLTLSERLMPDGTVQSGFQGTRLHHRIVARGGRQSWLAMHPTGFRYLELMVQSEHGETVIHDLRAVRLQLLEETGRFLCSDAVLNQVWQLCRETQIASIEDAFIDCPWRERGLYTGDQIVQYYINLALFGDHTMMRRCIDLFYQGQDESGLLPPCTHYLANWRHPDYAALSVESLWHYWARSGDVDFLSEKADALEKLLAGLDQLRSKDHGLVDGTGLFPYIDMSRIDRRDTSFGLNAFICGSFRLGSELLRVAGREVQAAAWMKKHNEYLARIREAYWCKSEKLFLDRRRTDEPQTKPSALGNALALYYGFVDGEEAKSCLNFVISCAENNLPSAKAETSFDFHFSAYSSYYALAILYRYGKGDVAERFMRNEWRRMLDGGAWACWEYFVPSHSLCHSWAASPVWYMSAHVLGVRYASSGDPDRLLFDPQPGTVEWAEGVFPHPRGPVRICWKQTAAGLQAEIAAPAGVEIDLCGHPVALTVDADAV